jgi:hypothetical protein
MGEILYILGIAVVVIVVFGILLCICSPNGGGCRVNNNGGRGTCNSCGCSVSQCQCSGGPRIGVIQPYGGVSNNNNDKVAAAVTLNVTGENTTYAAVGQVPAFNASSSLIDNTAAVVTFATAPTILCGVSTDLVATATTTGGSIYNAITVPQNRSQKEFTVLLSANITVEHTAAVTTATGLFTAIPPSLIGQIVWVPANGSTATVVTGLNSTAQMPVSITATTYDATTARVVLFTSPVSFQVTGPGSFQSRIDSVLSGDLLTVVGSTKFCVSKICCSSRPRRTITITCTICGEVGNNCGCPRGNFQQPQSFGCQICGRVNCSGNCQ